MNKRLLLIIPLAVVLVFTSCLPIPVSITQRIERFTTALNTAGSDLQQHFHPTETASYGQIADDEVFDTGPLAHDNATFTIGVPDNPGETVSCSFMNGVGSTGTIVFVMALDGQDYKIKSLTLTLDSDPGTDYTISYLSFIR